MTYNMTTLGGITNTWDLMNYANNASGSILFGMLMLSVFFVLLLGLKRYDFDVGFTTASFICFVLSSILVVTKFLSPIFTFVFLAFTAFGIFWLYVVRKWL